MTPTARLADDGEHVIWSHRCRSAGGLATESWLPTGAWTVVSADPITVQPSVYCHDCGTHGWIIDGEWRSA